MEISQLNPTSILDADQIDEVIHFDVFGNQKEFIFAKYRRLTTDFHGKPILDEDKYIRIKSLWYADMVNGNTEELVPYGHYDIQEIHIAQNYVYFIKIVDKDNDGVLDENYGDAEIWRVNKAKKTVEFCFDCKDKYTDFSFETANDNVVVFRNEDEVTQLFFVDLLNYKVAELLIDHGGENEFDFSFVEDEKNNPTYLLTKKWIYETEQSSPKYTLNCTEWTQLMKQLEWTPY